MSLLKDNFTEYLKNQTDKISETNKKMLICRQCGALVPENEVSAKGICARCIGIKVINSRNKKKERK